MARRTLAQLRSSVYRRVGYSSQITLVNITDIIADVHKDLASTYQWSQRRREAHLQTAGVYSTGTVTVTTDSATVTGAGTAWTAAMVGRAIQLALEDAYYYIRAVNVGLQTLELADAQLESVAWKGVSQSLVTFRIFQHQYALPPEVAIVLGNITDFPMVEMTRSDFDEKDPMRNSVGDPSEFALARTTIDGTPPVESVFIEFWPVPDRIIKIRVPYLIEPPELSADTDLPVCPPEPIEWRAAAEAAWFIYTKTGDARWDTLGKSYYQVYAGREDDGVSGVLNQALRDDQHRYGLPQIIGRDSQIGYDRLSERDWDAI